MPNNVTRRARETDYPEDHECIEINELSES